MCGRYTLTPAIDELLEALGLQGMLSDLLPRYNVAPTQMIPALISGEKGGFQLEVFRWGLVPFWAKDPAIGNRMINARGETVAEKPAFRAAFRSRRCLLLTDGWYEWKKGPGGKQPFRIQLETGEAFAFAGIWEHWEPKEEATGKWTEPIRSCAIITSEPSESIREIHFRMPVIMKRELWESWLDPDAEAESLLPMLGPYGGDDLKAYPVSTIVNSPSNDVEQCILPLSKSAGKQIEES